MKLIINTYRVIKSIISLLIWTLKQIKNENFKNYITFSENESPIKILGNGPSLNTIINDTNFHNTRNREHLCVVNNCGLSPIFKKLRPEHYVLADPLYFERPSRDQQVDPLIKILLHVDWNMKLYIPFQYYQLIKKEMLSNKYINVIPFHTNIIFNDSTNNKIKFWFYKKGLSCTRIQNVIIACLYCMINSGYKNIELYGVEHSWTNSLTVNENNQVCLRDSHYYDTEEVKILPWLKCSGEPYKMHEILRDLAYMFEGYFELKKYAEYIGNIKIVNKTPNSFIDAFDREI